MTIKTTKFDASEYLETEEDIKMFLEEAATGTSAEFIKALSIAAKARGMAGVASEAGVSRESLYRSLSSDGNPLFDTVNKIVHSFGCKITVTPI